VSGVGHGMGVVDRVYVPQAEGVVWGFGVPIHPINLIGVFFAH